MLKKSSENIIYYNEAADFARLPCCAEKTELAVSRLENPYNLTDDNRKMYHAYLEKERPKTIEEFISANKLSVFPLLVKYRVIKKTSVTKLVQIAQKYGKMDILSYLMNVSNEFRTAAKSMGIAPKFVSGLYTDMPQIFPIGDEIKPGNTIWMGKNPMPWVVLEKKKDKLMVISKYALDCQPYHETHNPVFWNDCSMRKWINTKFLQDNFSQQEISVMESVNIDDDDVLNFGGEDKLFFLSTAEVEKYFKTADERKARITARGKSKIMWTSFDVYAHWWLRSHGTLPVGAAYVQADGNVFLHGGTIYSNSYDLYFEHYGVRPAMCINIEKSEQMNNRAKC